MVEITFKATEVATMAAFVAKNKSPEEVDDPEMNSLVTKCQAVLRAVREYQKNPMSNEQFIRITVEG